MLKTLFNWILKTLFGVKTETNNAEINLLKNIEQLMKLILQVYLLTN